MLKATYLKKKIRFQCPCGYILDTFNGYKGAIVAVKLHFESFHKDLLPFGITNTEVLALLKKGRTYIVAGLQGGHDSFIWVKDLEGHDIGIWRDGEGYHYDSRRFRIVKSNMCKSACLDCKGKCDFYESIDSTLVR